MKKQSNRRMTHNDIFALVNSIKPVPFDITRRHISFQYITDSRFLPQTEILPKLNQMVRRFKTKADIEGLSYQLGDIQFIDWPEPEPCLQFRIKIWILKPRFNK